MIDALLAIVARHRRRRRRCAPSSTRGSPSSIRHGGWSSSPATAARTSATASRASARALGRHRRAARRRRSSIPVHLNPNVRAGRAPARRHPRTSQLIEPLDYLPFVYLMERSHLILTDFGGVQEEAPSLGKPVLVMRDTTERPEARRGRHRRAGRHRHETGSSARRSRLLTMRPHYERMARAHNPYGDGQAAARIREDRRGQPDRCASSERRSAFSASAISACRPRRSSPARR